MLILSSAFKPFKMRKKAGVETLNPVCSVAQGERIWEDLPGGMGLEGGPPRT